jgi:transketolase
VLGHLYIRFGRNPIPQIYGIDEQVEIGRGNLLRDGSDITLVACGAMVSLSLKAASILQNRGISAGVIDMVSVKPLDIELLLKQVRKTGAVVVAEDHQVTGGLFGAVAEALAPEMSTGMGVVAIQDSFGTSGSPAEVMKKFGLTASAIVEKAQAILKRNHIPTSG